MNCHETPRKGRLSRGARAAGVVAGLLLGATPCAASEFNVEFTVDGNPTRRMSPANPAEWRILYTHEDSGAPVTDFMTMHAKKMHMVVISSDLHDFAHIHPYLDTDTGSFSLNVNAPTDDPDNVDVPRTLTRPGEYFVFTEVMPRGRENMVMDRFAVTGEGRRPDLPEHEIDLPEGAERAVKYFTAASEPGEYGDAYEVTLEMELFQWCSWWLPKWYLTVRHWTGDGYEAPENFERWLSMGGHAILVSETGESLAEKVFYHLHAFLPMSEPGRFTFPYHDHDQPLPDGTYRIWGQFVHQGTILTFPFHFDYVNPPPPSRGKAGVQALRCR